MYEGNPVELQMKKMILECGVPDERVYSCHIVRYDHNEQFMYLALEQEELTVISLDGVYECRFSTMEGLFSCTGVIKERYQNVNGNVLAMQIENGFFEVDSAMSTVSIK